MENGHLQLSPEMLHRQPFYSVRPGERIYIDYGLKFVYRYGGPDPNKALLLYSPDGTYTKYFGSAKASLVNHITKHQNFIDSKVDKDPGAVYTWIENRIRHRRKIPDYIAFWYGYEYGSRSDSRIVTEDNGDF